MTRLITIGLQHLTAVIENYPGYSKLALFLATIVAVVITLETSHGIPAVVQHFRVR
jgi:hypothetical protein